MSFEVTTAFVNQFNANVTRALQEKGSILRPCVRVESQNSEYEYYDEIGSVEASEITTRHGDSPAVNTPHTRRRVGLSFYDVGDYIDKEDKVRMLIDPTSVYVQNFVDALGRKCSTVINAAALGSAWTGKSGATEVAFDTTNMSIANDFGSTGTSSNLTIGKMIRAKKLLLANYVEPGAEEWFFIITTSQWESLMNNTSVQSRDYNSVQALVRGDVDSLIGFKILVYEGLTKVSNDRYCLAFPKSAILLAVGSEIETHVAPRADKRFNMYAYARAGFGATRMNEKKIVRILCDETK